MNAVCELEQLTAERGVAALVGGAQVALFRVGDDVYAIDNCDPRTGANVLSRGIVGTIEDRWFVASPLHKERYALDSGARLDGDGPPVGIWANEIRDGIVHVGARRLGS